MTTRNTQSDTRASNAKGIARSTMNEDFRIPVNQDGLLETFAAELTLAAYRVVLRTGTQGTWLDLELELWSALADTVKTWGWGAVSNS